MAQIFAWFIGSSRLRPRPQLSEVLAASLGGRLPWRALPSARDIAKSSERAEKQ